MYYNNTTISEKTLNINTAVVNQTRKYLIPQLKQYGEVLIQEIRSLEIIGAFLQDYGVNISEEARKISTAVYFLFDVNGPSKFGHYYNVNEGRQTFMKSLQYFRKLKQYVIDYPFDSNKDGHFHVVVIDMPSEDKLEHFLKGEYSKMYSQQEINDWIPKDYITQEKGKDVVTKSPIYQVLTRDPEYFDIFAEKVYEEFRTLKSNIDPKAEYDFPPYMPNEILRYG